MARHLPFGDSEGGKRTVKWVLNTYRTADDWDVDQLIEICKKTGYEGIEFLQDFKQKHGLEADAPDSHVRAIKEKMQAASLITASVTTCCFFHEPEEADRRRNIAQAKRAIDQAALMDCDHLRVLG